MAFHDTKKNNGYHSLFIKLLGHVWGGAFFRTLSYLLTYVTLIYENEIENKPLRRQPANMQTQNCD